MTATHYLSTPVFRCSLVRERSIKTAPCVTSSAAAKAVAMEYLRDSPNERFIVLTLSTKNAVTSVAEITSGTLDASLVHPREVFRIAILTNSSSLIVAHNHPSGDTTPSREDYAVFERLKSAGELLGITVLDSLVTGEDSAISMAEIGGRA